MRTKSILAGDENRYSIYGAGAVGGVVGAGLYRAGHDVTLIARGARFDAIKRNGLTLEEPAGTPPLSISPVAHPSELEISGQDDVMLTMKSQDTLDPLTELSKMHRFQRLSSVCKTALRAIGSHFVFLRMSMASVSWPLTGAFLEPGTVIDGRIRSNFWQS